jgi:hypothetical protein
VLFSGLAPGYVGLYQVNALVPETTPGGTAVPVAIWMGSVVSNTVTIAVQSLSNPQPSIMNLSPSSAQVGLNSLSLTIIGNGFLSDSTVTFNGNPHPAAFGSSQQLGITLNASNLAIAGVYPVIVTNPSPGGGQSNVFNFSVTSPQPSISGIWQGSWTSVAGDSGAVGANFAQSGNSMTGQLLFTGSPCSAAGTASGTINEGTLSAGVVFGDGGQISFNGTLNGISGSGQGQYSVVSGPCAGDSGTFSLTRLSSQVSVTGNWQGSWFSVSGVSGSVSSNMSQSGNLLTGNISLTNSFCFSSGTTSGNIIADTISLGWAFSGNQEAAFNGLVSNSNIISGQYAVLRGGCSGGYGTFSISEAF